MYSSSVSTLPNISLDISPNLMLKLIKIANIIVISNIYFFLGITISYIIYKYTWKKYDTKKTKLQNFLQLLLEISLLAMSGYLVRIIVKNIPNPTNGLYGFDPLRLKELNGGVVLTFAFIFFLKDIIHDKIINIFFTNHSVQPSISSPLKTSEGSLLRKETITSPGATPLHKVLSNKNNI